MDVLQIAVVIPAYSVEAQIDRVLASIPDWVAHVVVVDDASVDQTAIRVANYAKQDRRVHLVQHEKNRGVGAAMKTGFRLALSQGADVVVKIDGDGQMDTRFLRALVEPLLLGNADYTKGNRLRNLRNLREMPFVRRAGNVGLSFFAKLASGYWNLSDPANGFVAVRADVLRRLRATQLHDRYYFEVSMLCELYLARAAVREVEMPAIYRDEKSHLRIYRVIFQFPALLLRSLIIRVFLTHFFTDFTLVGLYLSSGIPLLTAGFLFGSWKWWQSAQLGVPNYSGTVMIPALLSILGFQCVLAAIGADVQAMPTEPADPAHRRSLREAPQSGDFDEIDAAAK